MNNLNFTLDNEKIQFDCTIINDKIFTPLQIRTPICRFTAQRFHPLNYLTKNIKYLKRRGICDVLYSFSNLFSCQ